MNNKTIYIEIRDKAPGGNRIAIEFEIGDPYIQAFQPLNRNREIPFDVPAQMDAARTQDLRGKVTNIVCQHFQDLLTKQDPHNGYSPV